MVFWKIKILFFLILIFNDLNVLPLRLKIKIQLKLCDEFIYKVYNNVKW